MTRGIFLFGGRISNVDSLMGVIPMFVFPVCWSVGLDSKLYKLHDTYIKINLKYLSNDAVNYCHHIASAIDKLTSIEHWWNGTDR